MSSVRCAVWPARHPCPRPQPRDTLQSVTHVWTRPPLPRVPTLRLRRAADRLRMGVQQLEAARLDHQNIRAHPLLGSDRNDDAGTGDGHPVLDAAALDELVTLEVGCSPASRAAVRGPDHLANHWTALAR